MDSAKELLRAMSQYLHGREPPGPHENIHYSETEHRFYEASCARFAAALEQSP